jgi:predicted transcriptional regulator
MIRDLEIAIEKICGLPEERQRYLARILQELAEPATVHDLGEHERKLVQEGLDAADAGRVVTEGDMEAFWSRHRS